MRQEIKHRDIRLLNMIRRTDTVIPLSGEVLTLFKGGVADINKNIITFAIPFREDDKISFFLK